MLKNYRCGTAIVGVVISCLAITAHADPSICSKISRANALANIFNDSQIAPLCDVTFSVIPTFAAICILQTESGTYQITNNSPVAVAINYIRIQVNDNLPESTTTITAAPVNNCVVGSSLAAGASCNILLNIAPTVSGTLNRVLQIGIDSRQVELDAPAIAFTVCSTPPGPPSSTFFYSPTLSVTLDCTILGGSTVTNTGASAVNGNVCLNPGTSITGFPPGTISNGSEQINTGLTTTARTSLTTIETYIDGLTCPGPNDLTGQDLGGLVLTPGVYCFSSSAQLTGALTLVGSPTDFFYFQIGTTLTTASASSVLLLGGITSANVFWDVDSSATIGLGTSFQGNILTTASSTITTGASVSGRVLANAAGAVTLDTNAVSP